jgi:rod shape-determining protein MreC
VLASLALMTLDHRLAALQGIRATLSVAIYPLQYTVNLPFRLADWTTTTLRSQQTLVVQNNELRERKQELEFRQLRMAALEEENQRLRAMLQSSSRQWEQVLIAELMSVSYEPLRRQLLVNKGSHHGVFIGQPVVDAHGIMGQVIHTSLFSSSVLLITDPRHNIPIQVNRNGLRTLAAGTGNPEQMEILYLPNNADIQVGDLLVSSGLGRRFPAGYPVAEVSHIERDPSEPVASIHARPLAQLEQTREVLLVWPATTEEARP